MHNKQVRELMESDLVTVSPDATLKEAAQKMKEADCGFLPVAQDSGPPQGIITDRDIVVRAIADGKEPEEQKVGDYMSREIYACRDTDTLEDAATIMRDHNVSRLVVRDENNQICGVLTFGRIIRSDEDREETSEVVDIATGRAVA